jgi:hypothetical protein
MIASGYYFSFLLFGFLVSWSFGARGSAGEMGGASRRPDNSGFGEYLQTCSNAFYQKFLRFSKSTAARKGVKGERNCCCYFVD